MQYKTGTVNVTQNSATVTGVGTQWVGQIQPGHVFVRARMVSGRRVDDAVYYTVANVNSNTSLTLSAPYVGGTGTGQPYGITRELTPNGLPLLAPQSIGSVPVFNGAVLGLESGINAGLEDSTTKANAAQANAIAAAAADATTKANAAQVNAVNTVALLEKLRNEATFLADFTKNEYRVWEPPYGQELKTITQAITTTRASEGTVNTPFGVQTRAANIPRIEYDYDTGVSGLLCEEQRTNLLQQSTNLLNNYWFSGSATARTDSGIPSPFTGVNFTQLQAISDNAILDVSRLSDVGYQAGAITASVLWKNKDIDRLMFVLGGGNVRITVHVLNNTATLNSEAIAGGFTHRVVEWGNGVYRVSVTGNVTGDGSFRLFPRNTDGTGFSDTALTGQSALLALPQLETGSFPTSYIKTEASQVTRAGDLHAINIAPPAEATWFVEGSMAFNNFRRLLGVQGPASAGGANTIALGMTAAYGAWYLSVTKNGVQQAPFTTRPWQANVTAKHALSISAGRLIWALNGEIVINASIDNAMPIGVDTMVVGGTVTGTTLAATVKNVKYFPRALSDEELQELTRL